jgi:lysophospholipase L1-like esterase
MFHKTRKEFNSKTIMVIGSSMTERAYHPEHMGFGIGLSNWYSRTADVLVRGQGGYNSRWILLGLDEIIGNHVPDLVILFIGNNDVKKRDNMTLNVNLEEYSSNIQQIINKLKAVNCNVRIIILTPTRSIIKGRTLEHTRNYVNAIKCISSKNSNTYLLDLWEGDYMIMDNDLCDNLHLGVEGNRKVFEGIKHIIKSQISEFVPFKDSLDKERGLQYLFPKCNRQNIHNMSKEILRIKNESYNQSYFNILFRFFSQIIFFLTTFIANLTRKYKPFRNFVSRIKSFSNKSSYESKIFQ